MPHFNLHQLSTGELYALRMARWKARTDLEYLAHDILGYKDVCKAVNGPVLDILQKFPLAPEATLFEHERFDRGNVVYKPLTPMYNLPSGRRVLILDPRSFLKTTINAQSHTIQWILNYPGIALQIIQSNSQKAEDILREIKRHFQSNLKFRALFPDYCPQKKVFDWGTQAYCDIPNRGDNVEARQHTIMTGSIDKGSAGYHFDVMKFSDIVEPNNVKTPEQIRAVIDAFAMMENLLVRPDGWIDVEGTRYDFSDLYGEIIKAEKERPLEEREWRIHVRGVYKKDTSSIGGAPERFTPDELDLPYARDEHGQKISWWPERWTVQALERQRKNPAYGERLFACTPGYAEILMADWTAKPISEVKIGDSVVGWQREPKKINGKRSFPELITATVLDKGSHEQEVFEYILTSGRTLHCTEDHLWWNARKEVPGDTHKEYHTPRLGRRVVRVYEPPNLTPEQEKELYWLAGFIDGEGRVQSNGIVITQSERVNPHICRRLEECLKSLNIHYKIWVRKGKGVNYYVLNGGRTLRIILSRLKMGKHQALVDGLWKHRRTVGAWDKIISVRSLGVMSVYWLTTTSGNYVSQGYASKNCQKLNNPVAVEDTSRVPFPVNMKYPIWTPRKSFNQDIRIAFRTTTIDTAQTVTQRSDYTAITTAAWSSSGRCFIEDIRWGKFLPDETVEWMFWVQKKFNPLVQRIEKTGFVDGLMPTINRKMQLGDPKYPHINIELVKRDTDISKKERILNVLEPWYKSGELRFLEDLSEDVKDELKDELQRFPLYRQDDILDTIADQFQGRDYFGRLQARPNFRQAQEDAMNVLLGFTHPAESIFSPESPYDGHYNRTGGL